MLLNLTKVLKDFELRSPGGPIVRTPKYHKTLVKIINHSAGSTRMLKRNHQHLKAPGKKHTINVPFNVFNVSFNVLSQRNN